ncbi:MAG: ATP-grasp domain-containing protein [Bacteroidaceae bacterium]|nr:ATP-grasp domain-containing protein [Bacteroidaceae bacterium]
MDEIKNHTFIVFCGDHYNPLGIVRSIGEWGISPVVILVAEHPVMINHSRYVKRLHHVQTMEDGYKILLSDYGNEPLKPFLYTSDDGITSLLDLHYDELIDKFYFFHGLEKGIITRYMDKENICNLAVECGAQIAKTEMVIPGTLPKEVRYPLITKAIISTLGGWKGDSFICRNEEELREAYRHIRSERILLQEFIDKKNELCLDGFCYNNGTEVVIPYYSNYLRFTNKSYGPYMMMKPFVDEKVLGWVKAMLQKVGFTGIFSVEFLIDKNDNLYFLEVNFRNSTWSYAYTCGGYNMPILWAKATLEGHLDLSEKDHLEKFTAMVEPDDFVENVIKHRKVGLFQWIKQVEKAKLYYYNYKDNSPFWHYLWMRLLRPFKK